MDLVSLGGGGEARPLLPHLEGVSQGWSVTRFPVDSADLRDDSLLHVQLEIDANSPSCNWAVNVHRSQLVVYYTINRSPNTPECSGPICVTAESLLCVTATASDPDGDNVHLEYSWYLLGAPASDTDSCLSEEIHAFEDWTCKVWAVDEHGVRSEPCSTVFNIMESCQENPTLGYDYGDLDTCYHTGTVNEGGPSNPIKRDNVAWLGDAVNVDQFAHSPSDTDDYDDGVVFLNPLNWLPCAQVCVDVTITTGPGFDPNIDSLYLYGFKDGSFPANCSFTDSFCNPRAYECIIQGVEITGLQANSDTTRRFCFTDPGVLEGQGRYNGIFRFRLLTQYVSPCVDAVATNDPVGGETEDYIITDLQLPVELLSFQVAQDGNAVVLRWATASERDNDYFRIERRTSSAWSTVAARIRGAGSSSVTHTYSYRDATVEAGTIYEYRLTSVDYNGTVHALGTQSIPVVQHDPVMVSEYRLYPNYPNPFNPTTTIAFDLAEAGHVSLRVYDVMGREVAVLVNGNLPAGRHREVFDAQGLPSGVYVYKLTSGSFTDMQKMVLLK
ncbi:MAG: T9SS type A sorting domain-containing protein [bacterium]|nr:T9SS type A sorting domain-containing protein [bacterium]